VRKSALLLLLTSLITSTFFLPPSVLASCEEDDELSETTVEGAGFQIISKGSRVTIQDKEGQVVVMLRKKKTRSGRLEYRATFFKDGDEEIKTIATIFSKSRVTYQTPSGEYEMKAQEVKRGSKSSLYLLAQSALVMRDILVWSGKQTGQIVYNATSTVGTALVWTAAVTAGACVAYTYIKGIDVTEKVTGALFQNLIDGIWWLGKHAVLSATTWSWIHKANSFAP